MLDGRGVKAMPGSIPAPNPGSFNKLKRKKNTGSQMGHTKKIILKKISNEEQKASLTKIHRNLTKDEKISFIRRKYF